MSEHDTSRSADPSGESAGLAGFARRVLVAGAVLGLLLTFVLILWFQVHVLLLGLAGVLLAVFLYTMAAWVAAKTRMPYWLSLAAIGVLLLALGAGGVWLVGSRIARQSENLQEQLPQAWARVQSYLDQQGWGRWLMRQLHSEQQGAQQGGMVQPAVKMASSVGKGFAEAFVVLFVGIFGAISPQLYVRGAMRLIPLRHRPRVRRLVQESGNLLWWWLVGQLVSMAFIGVVTAAALWLVGVPLALTLGLIAAILNFIPNFGPIVSAVPAVLLALLQSPATAGWVLVVYVIIQFVQNHLVTPVIQQRAVELPPVLLILAQLVMYYWDGLLGMLLAPVLAAVALRIVQIVYVRDTLGDPMAKSRSFWPDERGEQGAGTAPAR